ncbi:NAD(P)/FAD-dependent oxidoreductase [Candidatus Micrarchaeota archaeon]|nr:NAD(P)/FAD-dependent oxidoreductase [Candidatus Micrarchaeota archaeon]
MYDVHVIGGGPSGLISAISASRAGAKVILSEEHSRSGIPQNCSGLISKSGIETLSPFVDYKPAVINEISKAVLYFGFVPFRVNSDSVAYVCNRSEFDYALSQNAEKEGVKIEYNSRVRDNFKSDTIIGADGPFSSVASYCNLSQIQKYVSTMQAVVRYKVPDLHCVELYFSNSLFPGFFGWIIPHNEEYSEFGVGVSLPGDAKSAFASLFRLKGLRFPSNFSSFIIPVSIRKNSFSNSGKKKVMLVGDAAGQVKSTTGGGVVFGGNCAAIAGSMYSDPYPYEQMWRKKFGADLYLHQMIRSFLDRLDDNSMTAFGKFLNTLRFGNFLSKYGDMDHPTSIFSPKLAKHFAGLIF